MDSAITTEIIFVVDCKNIEGVHKLIYTHV